MSRPLFRDPASLADLPGYRALTRCTRPWLERPPGVAAQLWRSRRRSGNVRRRYGALGVVPYCGGTPDGVTHDARPSLAELTVAFGISLITLGLSLAPVLATTTLDQAQAQQPTGWERYNPHGYWPDEPFAGVGLAQSFVPSKASTMVAIDLFVIAAEDWAEPLTVELHRSGPNGTLAATSTIPAPGHPHPQRREVGPRDAGPAAGRLPRDRAHRWSCRRSRRMPAATPRTSRRSSGRGERATPIPRRRRSWAAGPARRSARTRHGHRCRRTSRSGRRSSPRRKPSRRTRRPSR